MYFANPWGLLGLLALPAILAIHFFHRRYPPLVIAGAHLWGIETEVQTMGRRWDRLPLSASLLLELLAALLLALLLSQPRLGILGSARHVVVVLDHSASMQAGPPNGPTFRDRALEKLRERMETLPRGSRITIILSGPIPQTLAGPAARWEEAEQRLSDWTPRLPKHQFGPAWDLAARFADQTGDLLFLTDHLPGKEETIPAAMEILAVGEELRNVAITTAEWTFDESQESTQVYLRVANFGPTQAAVDVKAQSPESVVFSQTLQIPSGSEEPLQFKVPTGRRQLTVDVFLPADGLSVDNSITLMEPKPRPVKISVELPKGSAAQEAVMEGLSVLPGVELAPPEDADLQIGTADPLPPSERDLWWLGIGPLDRSETAKENAIDLQGPYILKRRDPLVRGLELGTLIWGGVQPIAIDATPLISCDQLPLLVKPEGTLTTGYVLNIDMARSQLAASEDWPIFLSNLVEQRRRNLPGLNRWNFRLNDTVRFRAPESLDPTTPRPELKLVSENSTRTLIRGPKGFVEVASLDEPALYDLKAGDVTIDRIAVNFFDVEESDLSELGSGVRAPETDDSELFQLDNPYSWLILLGLVLVLACVVFDWKSLHS